MLCVHYIYYICQWITLTMISLFYYCAGCLLSRVTSEDNSLCDLRLKLRFFSLLDVNELADITKETSCSPTDLIINRHQCFHPTASSLIWKVLMFF